MSAIRTRQQWRVTADRLVAADVMHADPPHCLGTQSLNTVVDLMQEKDCDTMTVVNNGRERRPIGVINNQDIAARRLADGTDAMRQPAQGCMSSPIVAVFLDTSVPACGDTMLANELDYLPVIDRGGQLRGFVGQD